MTDQPHDDPSTASPGDEAMDDVIEFAYLEYHVDEHVAVVTIRRESALNALNDELMMELALAFELAEADVEVRALVVTGSGRAFVAGADLGNIERIQDAFTGREFALAGQDLMNALAALPFPTIAAINGFALGGGLELALACDLRVSARDAKLGLPEVTRGIFPGYGGTQRLARLIGPGRALDLILTGRHVNADEALQLGLVNRVVDDALEGALDVARIVVKNAPVALGLAKEAVARGLDVTLPQGLEVEADLFGMVSTTEDAKEGARSFFEKRAAEFDGK